MVRRIEAVLFDAVGTVIEPVRPIGETYARVSTAHGLPVASAELDAAFRVVFPQMKEMAFPTAAGAAIPDLERAWWRELVRRTFRVARPGVSINEVDALFPALFDAFAEAQSWRERAGARDALRALRSAGRRCAMVSNFDHRLHDILEGLALARFFEFVLLPGEACATKPSPRVFRTALHKLALPAAAVALVGDSERDDLEGARAAGIHGVDVRRLATLADLEAHLVELESDEHREGDE